MNAAWVVLLRTEIGDVRPYGPFDDEAVAQCFGDFLTTEVDPAEVVSLRSPVAELLSFWGTARDAKPAGAERPIQWPPSPGDVWEDRDGDRWICGRVPSGTPYLVCVAKQGDDNAEEIWRTHGPLIYVHHIAPNAGEPPF